MDPPRQNEFEFDYLKSDKSKTRKRRFDEIENDDDFSRYVKSENSFSTQVSPNTESSYKYEEKRIKEVSKDEDDDIFIINFANKVKICNNGMSPDPITNCSKYSQ